MRINAEFALNSLSFGFCSVNILLELFKRKGIEICLFPIASNLDLSSYNALTHSEITQITEMAQKAQASYSSEDPGLRLWHINGSIASPSRRKSLITFFELDSLTDIEKNILRNQDSIFVTSKLTKEVFDEALGGKTPVIYCPLGFDNRHFEDLGKREYPDHITSFSIFGKFEKRKHHAEAIRGWVKKFGNNPKYVLNLHVFNPFMNADQNNQLLSRVFEGKRYWNVNTVPYLKTLAELNKCFNAADIVIDMSGGEGFSLPSFHCLGIGKHGVIHNCSAMSDWANEKNAVLVNPTGKEDVFDGIFFHKGHPFNQGRIFTWDEDEYIDALTVAAERFRIAPKNIAGLELQAKFSWENTVNILMESIR